MKKRDRDELLASTSLVDLPEVWNRLTSQGQASAVKYPYTAADASRARKYLSVALGFAPYEGARPEAADIERVGSNIRLMELLHVNIEQMAARARAAFLWIQHDIPMQEALGVRGACGLPDLVRKAANNTKASVLRAMRFVRDLGQSGYGLTPGSDWPERVNGTQYAAGMILYSEIQRRHVSQGMLSPLQATPQSVREAAQKYVTLAKTYRKAGDFNTKVRQLRRAIREGLLPGFPQELLSELEEIRYSTNGPAAALSEAQLIDLWPVHFQENSDHPGHLDRTRGLLGFFNKRLGSPRPTNPFGKRCPKDNLNLDRALQNRISVLQRLLYRGRQRDGDRPPRPLEEYFSGEELTAWLDQYVDERNVVTVHHKNDYIHAIYVANLYFEQDTFEFCRWAEDEFDFPERGESLRGTRVVELAGSPDVFMDWGEAWNQYASNAPTIAAHPRKADSGFYLPRKSCEVELRIRVETGLRPENVDELDVVDGPAASNVASTIWKNPDGTYGIAVSMHLMKQHKRRRFGASRRSATPAQAGRATAARRCYRFILERPETIAALDEYLSNGWKHARDVVSGETRRLLLNRGGHPFRPGEVGDTYCDMRPRAAALYRKKTGKVLPPLDRYAHRHVLGAALERHVPGSALKTQYLTHRISRGSDVFYGDDDARFLRTCLSEILDGKPPRPEQEKQRLEAQAQREHEREKREGELHGCVIQLTDEVGRLRATLDRKEEEIRRLSGMLAEQRADGGRRSTQ